MTTPIQSKLVTFSGLISIAKGIRQRRGMDQNEVARRAGISSSSVSNVERQTRSPQIETVEMLFKGLGYEILYTLRPLPEDASRRDSSGS